MSAQFDNILSTIPATIPAGFAHQYDDVDDDHIVHAFKHLETNEMRFFDDEGNEYAAHGDGVFEVIARAETPEEPEEPVSLYGGPITLSDLQELGNEELRLFGFQLTGKVTSRIRTYALRLLNQVRNAPELDGIDGANELLAEMEAMAANASFLGNSGLETETAEEKQLFNREQMRRFMAAYQALTTAYANNNMEMPGQSLAEVFMWIVGNAGERETLTESQVQMLAVESGARPEDIRAEMQVKVRRAQRKAMDDAKEAYALVMQEEPLPEEPEPDYLRAGDSERCDLLTTMWNDSIDSAMKNRHKGYGAHDEKMADIVYLKSLLVK